MENIMLKEGRQFNVFALGWDRGEVIYCPAIEFIDRMSDSSRKSILNVISRHADFGPSFNEQKSRLIEDGIYEFKSRQGDRLLYFYSPAERGATIITHGFRKGARLRTEIQRAINYRTEYLDSLR